MARAAGTSVSSWVRTTLCSSAYAPSSELRRVLLTCRATIGEVGNAGIVVSKLVVPVGQVGLRTKTNQDSLY